MYEKLSARVEGVVKLAHDIAREYEEVLALGRFLDVAFDQVEESPSLVGHLLLAGGVEPAVP